MEGADKKVVPKPASSVPSDKRGFGSRIEVPKGRTQVPGGAECGTPAGVRIPGLGWTRGIAGALNAPANFCEPAGFRAWARTGWKRLMPEARRSAVRLVMVAMEGIRKDEV